MGGEGGIERDAALRGECGRSAVVHRVRWHQCDTGVTMLRVVPAEKVLAMRPCILDRTEARWEVGSVLQGFGAPCKGAISQWGLDPPGNCRNVFAKLMLRRH